MKNIGRELMKLGIKVTIIPHDINTPFGRFTPKEYQPLNMPNDKCYIVKFSYPAIEGKNVGYMHKDELDGAKPVRYTSPTEWKHSVEPRIENQYKRTDGIHEGLIPMGEFLYPEEILWWFSFGNKPTIYEALYNIFRDFEVLENAFEIDKWSTGGFDLDNIFELSKIFKELEMLPSSFKSWDELERQHEIWYRVTKLYARIKLPFGYMFVQNSTGLGASNYLQLKEFILQD